MDSVKHRVALACTIGALLGAILFFWIWRARPVTPDVSAAVFSAMPTITSVTAPMRGGGVSTAEESIRILFVGDIMLDRHVAEKMRVANDPMYPFRALPDNWFDSFDYAVANLEGPVTSKRIPTTKEISFQFDPSVAVTLKQLGIDAVSQANNHTLDQGRAGFENSLATLRRAGLITFGHQVRDDEIALATTTIRGKHFAFLGFNTTDNALDEKAAERVLAEARLQNDYVIVFMHWGSEYRAHPNADVINRAHWLIDHGADAVIGGHPHWVQGMETYRGKPIAYSLGNFVFDQYFSRETQEGLAVVLTFDGDRISLEPLPIKLDKSQPRLVEGEEKEQRLRELLSSRP